MRIGIFDPYLDDGGGGEKYMMTIAEVLAQEHEVFVFWNNKEDLENVKKRFNLNLKNVTVTENILSSQVPFIKRLTDSRKYDAIVVLSDGSLPFLLSKLYIHFQRPLEHVSLNLFSKIKKKRISAFFCNSEYTKKFIDKTFQINSEVIYPPVQINSTKGKKENVILHVGRFRVVDKTVGVKDFKKQFVMLHVFKEMIDEGFKNWKLVMAVSVQKEDEKEFEQMKKIADGYPVEFVVNKTNEELWKQYERAKVYWHASGYGENLEKNPEYAEHFGISTVEAMGAGVVPVVINSGGQKEIVSDGVDGFRWDTLDEFKKKTLRVCNSETLFKQLSLKALEKAEMFTKVAFEKKIREMITS